MNRYIAGAVAGFAATVPMTLFMIAAHRRLPREEQYPQPPAEVTVEAAKKTGVDEYLETREEWKAAIYAAHFSYGTAAGAVYGAAQGAQIPLPPLVKGSLYGLTVWSVSYLALIPALGLLTPATEHPARRNALAIAANVLWGAVAVTLADQLTNDQQR